MTQSQMYDVNKIGNFFKLDNGIHSLNVIINNKRKHLFKEVFINLKNKKDVFWSFKSFIISLGNTLLI